MGCVNTPRATVESWYGASAAWRIPLERDAFRLYGRQIRLHQTATTLTYIHAGLRVRGRVDPVPVAIQFDIHPRYGLAAKDYPRVFADPGAQSKHRMLDDSLCLYYVGDPADRRWTSDKGLLSLLGLIADHLFFEGYWRSTGGESKGLWLAPEAPHGFAA